MNLTCDITKYAKEIDVSHERLLLLERYSRDYNLRFYNIPESTGEDCIANLRDIIGNDLQFQPNIENAHGIGPLAVFMLGTLMSSRTLKLSRDGFHVWYKNEK